MKNVEGKCDDVDGGYDAVQQTELLDDADVDDAHVEVARRHMIQSGSGFRPVSSRSFQCHLGPYVAQQRRYNDHASHQRTHAVDRQAQYLFKTIYSFIYPNMDLIRQESYLLHFFPVDPLNHLHTVDKLKVVIRLNNNCSLFYYHTVLLFSSSLIVS